MGKEDRKQKKELEYSGAEAELLEQRKAMLVSLMNEEAYVPMKLKELAILLNVPKEQREELKQVLNLLLAEGKISVSKKGKFGKAEAFALVGVFSGNARGFGFVAIEGQEEDVFIPADRTGEALHGDGCRLSLTVREEAAVRRERLCGFWSTPMKRWWKSIKKERDTASLSRIIRKYQRIFLFLRAVIRGQSAAIRSW